MEEGYCLTGLSAFWLQANQFGRPVAAFLLGPGRALPEHRFEYAQVLLTIWTVASISFSQKWNTNPRLSHRPPPRRPHKGLCRFPYDVSDQNMFFRAVRSSRWRMAA
jgi:hypothetical protein